MSGFKASAYADPFASDTDDEDDADLVNSRKPFPKLNFETVIGTTGKTFSAEEVCTLQTEAEYDDVHTSAGNRIHTCGMVGLADELRNSESVKVMKLLTADSEVWYSPDIETPICAANMKAYVRFQTELRQGTAVDLNTSTSRQNSGPQSFWTNIWDKTRLYEQYEMFHEAMENEWDVGITALKDNAADQLLSFTPDGDNIEVDSDDVMVDVYSFLCTLIYNQSKESGIPKPFEIAKKASTWPKSLTMCLTGRRGDARIPPGRKKRIISALVKMERIYLIGVASSVCSGIVLSETSLALSESQIYFIKEMSTQRPEKAMKSQFPHLLTSDDYIRLSQEAIGLILSLSSINGEVPRTIANRANTLAMFLEIELGSYHKKMAGSRDLSALGEQGTLCTLLNLSLPAYGNPVTISIGHLIGAKGKTDAERKEHANKKTESYQKARAFFADSSNDSLMRAYCANLLCVDVRYTSIDHIPGETYAVVAAYGVPQIVLCCAGVYNAVQKTLALSIADLSDFRSCLAECVIMDSISGVPTQETKCSSYADSLEHFMEVCRPILPNETGPGEVHAAKNKNALRTIISQLAGADLAAVSLSQFREIITLGVETSIPYGYATDSTKQADVVATFESGAAHFEVKTTNRDHNGDTWNDFTYADHRLRAVRNNYPGHSYLIVMTPDRVFMSGNLQSLKNIGSVSMEEKIFISNPTTCLITKERAAKEEVKAEMHSFDEAMQMGEERAGRNMRALDELMNNPANETAAKEFPKIMANCVPKIRANPQATYDEHRQKSLTNYFHKRDHALIPLVPIHRIDTDIMIRLTCAHLLKKYRIPGMGVGLRILATLIRINAQKMKAEGMNDTFLQLSQSDYKKISGKAKGELDPNTMLLVRPGHADFPPGPVRTCIQGKEKQPDRTANNLASKHSVPKGGSEKSFKYFLSLVEMASEADHEFYASISGQDTPVMLNLEGFSDGEKAQITAAYESLRGKAQGSKAVAYILSSLRMTMRLLEEEMRVGAGNTPSGLKMTRITDGMSVIVAGTPVTEDGQCIMVRFLMVYPSEELARLRQSGFLFQGTEMRAGMYTSIISRTITLPFRTLAYNASSQQRLHGAALTAGFLPVVQHNPIVSVLADHSKCNNFDLGFCMAKLQCYDPLTQFGPNQFNLAKQSKDSKGTKHLLALSDAVPLGPELTAMDVGIPTNSVRRYDGMVTDIDHTDIRGAALRDPMLMIALRQAYGHFLPMGDAFNADKSTGSQQESSSLFKWYKTATSDELVVLENRSKTSLSSTRNARVPRTIPKVGKIGPNTYCVTKYVNVDPVDQSYLPMRKADPIESAADLGRRLEAGAQMSYDGSRVMVDGGRTSPHASNPIFLSEYGACSVPVERYNTDASLALHMTYPTFPTLAFGVMNIKAGEQVLPSHMAAETAAYYDQTVSVVDPDGHPDKSVPGVATKRGATRQATTATIHSVFTQTPKSRRENDYALDYNARKCVERVLSEKSIPVKWLVLLMAKVSAALHKAGEPKLRGIGSNSAEINQIAVFMRKAVPSHPTDLSAQGRATMPAMASNVKKLYYEAAQKGLILQSAESVYLTGGHAPEEATREGSQVSMREIAPPSSPREMWKKLLFHGTVPDTLQETRAFGKAVTSINLIGLSPSTKATLMMLPPGPALTPRLEMASLHSVATDMTRYMPYADVWLLASLVYILLVRTGLSPRDASHVAVRFGNTAQRPAICSEFLRKALNTGIEHQYKDFHRHYSHAKKCGMGEVESFQYATRMAKLEFPTSSAGLDVLPEELRSLCVNQLPGLEGLGNPMCAAVQSRLIEYLMSECSKYHDPTAPRISIVLGEDGKMYAIRTEKGISSFMSSADDGLLSILGTEREATQYFCHYQASLGVQELNPNITKTLPSKVLVGFSVNASRDPREKPGHWECWYGQYLYVEDEPIEDIVQTLIQDTYIQARYLFRKQRKSMEGYESATLVQESLLAQTCQAVADLNPVSVDVSVTSRFHNMDNAVEAGNMANPFNTEVGLMRYGVLMSNVGCKTGKMVTNSLDGFAGNNVTFPLSAGCAITMIAGPNDFREYVLRKEQLEKGITASTARSFTWLARHIHENNMLSSRSGLGFADIVRYMRGVGVSRVRPLMQNPFATKEGKYISQLSFEVVGRAREIKQNAILSKHSRERKVGTMMITTSHTKRKRPDQAQGMPGTEILAALDIHTIQQQAPKPVMPAQIGQRWVMAAKDGRIMMTKLNMVIDCSIMRLVRAPVLNIPIRYSDSVIRSAARGEMIFMNDMVIASPSIGKREQDITQKSCEDARNPQWFHVSIVKSPSKFGRINSVLMKPTPSSYTGGLFASLEAFQEMQTLASNPSLFSKFMPPYTKILNGSIGSTLLNPNDDSAVDQIGRRADHDRIPAGRTFSGEASASDLLTTSQTSVGFGFSIDFEVRAMVRSTLAVSSIPQTALAAIHALAALAIDCRACVSLESDASIGRMPGCMMSIIDFVRTQEDKMAAMEQTRSLKDTLSSIAKEQGIADVMSIALSRGNLSNLRGNHIFTRAPNNRSVSIVSSKWMSSSVNRAASDAVSDFFATSTFLEYKNKLEVDSKAANKALFASFGLFMEKKKIAGTKRRMTTKPMVMKMTGAQRQVWDNLTHPSLPEKSEKNLSRFRADSQAFSLLDLVSGSSNTEKYLINLAMRIESKMEQFSKANAYQSASSILALILIAAMSMPSFERFGTTHYEREDDLRCVGIHSYDLLNGTVSALLYKSTRSPNRGISRIQSSMLNEISSIRSGGMRQDRIYTFMVNQVAHCQALIYDEDSMTHDLMFVAGFRNVDGKSVNNHVSCPDSFHILPMIMLEKEENVEHYLPHSVNWVDGIGIPDVAGRKVTPVQRVHVKFTGKASTRVIKVPFYTGDPNLLIADFRDISAPKMLTWPLVLPSADAITIPWIGLAKGQRKANRAFESASIHEVIAQNGKNKISTRESWIAIEKSPYALLIHDIMENFSVSIADGESLLPPPTMEEEKLVTVLRSFESRPVGIRGPFARLAAIEVAYEKEHSEKMLAQGEKRKMLSGIPKVGSDMRAQKFSMSDLEDDDDEVPSNESEMVDSDVTYSVTTQVSNDRAFRLLKKYRFPNEDVKRVRLCEFQIDREKKKGRERIFQENLEIDGMLYLAIRNAQLQAHSGVKLIYQDESSKRRMREEALVDEDEYGRFDDPEWR